MSWNYELECGSDLRNAIKDGNCNKVLELLKVAYKALLDKGVIDEDEYNEHIEDMCWMDPKDEDFDVDELDYELDKFYDLCDERRVWIPLD